MGASSPEPSLNPSPESTWIDPRMPARTDCVIGALIDRRAAEDPDKVMVMFADASHWTRRQLRDQVRACAAGLQALGVEQGDPVLCWMANSPTMLTVMLAINYLGAIYIPVNTAYKGSLLQHVVSNADARLAVVDAALVDGLVDVDTGRLATVVCIGPPARTASPAATDQPAGAARRPGFQRLPASVLSGDATLLRPTARPIEPWHTLAVIYTSGTTGPSKGVLVSSLQVYANYISAQHAGPDDRTLVALPLFHMSAAGGTWGTLMRGGSLALVESFKTGEFWHTIRRLGVTHSTLLGVMATFLLKQPPSPQDREHPLRRVVSAPLIDQHEQFTARFGVAVHTAWNMTETSSPLRGGPDLPRGTCGRLRPGVQVRIVDDFDCEVAAGEVGELIIRTDMPFAMSHGYHRDPDATARAWRNGWFHSGDAFRCDADGYYYFVDRKKDAIRRRGENISSFEVEKELLAHPAVRDAAVVAVPGEFGEDEVLAILCPVPGQVIDLPALVGFLVPRMAHFMVPRYFRVIDDLPRTPTNKVQKTELRTQGLTPYVWDREAAGLRLKRPG